MQSDALARERHLDCWGSRAGLHLHSNCSRVASDFVGGMRHSGRKPQCVRWVSSLISRPSSTGTGCAQVGLGATS